MQQAISSTRPSINEAVDDGNRRFRATGSRIDVLETDWRALLPGSSSWRGSALATSLPALRTFSHR